jgi:hypothetical protein
MLVDIRRHVLALVRLLGVAACHIEGRARENLGVKPARERALARVTDDARLAFGCGRIAGHHGIDDLGTNQRTVRRHAHHNIGATGCRSASIAPQNVGKAAAIHRGVLRGGQSGDRVIVGAVAGRNHHLIKHRGPPQSPDDMRQHRNATKRQQHLARQPLGAHASLDNGNGLHSGHQALRLRKPDRHAVFAQIKLGALRRRFGEQVDGARGYGRGTALHRL